MLTRAELLINLCYEILCLKVSTTPIKKMRCRQCTPLSVIQLKGKHCQKHHCHNGVIDTFGQNHYPEYFPLQRDAQNSDFCSFFGRIENSIICFRNFLTFNLMVLSFVYECHLVCWITNMHAVCTRAIIDFAIFLASSRFHFCRNQ